MMMMMMMMVMMMDYDRCCLALPAAGGEHVWKARVGGVGGDGWG